LGSGADDMSIDWAAAGSTRGLSNSRAPQPWTVRRARVELAERPVLDGLETDSLAFRDLIIGGATA